MGDTILLISDLHFDDSLESEYKWGIFNEIKSIYKETQFDGLFILGDITDKKDRHSGRLVNRLVTELSNLSIPIYILRGNHDGLDPNYPYFDFLNHYQNMKFIKEVTIFENLSRPLAFYPHNTADQYVKISGSISFFHQTFSGTIYENGQQAQGDHFVDPEFGSLCFSGDIHKPQQVGDVIYIGSPYHTRHGDSFDPRVILLDLDSLSYKSIPVDLAKKITLSITSIEEFEEKIGQYSEDMVRIQINGIDNDLTTKIFNHIAERRKDCPSIQTVQVVKMGAEDIQLIKMAPKSDVELIKEYAEIKKMDEYTTKIGIKIHEKN